MVSVDYVVFAVGSKPELTFFVLTQFYIYNDSQQERLADSYYESVRQLPGIRHPHVNVHTRGGTTTRARYNHNDWKMEMETNLQSEQTCLPGTYEDPDNNNDDDIDSLSSDSLASTLENIDFEPSVEESNNNSDANNNNNIIVNKKDLSNFLESFHCS